MYKYIYIGKTSSPGQEDTKTTITNTTRIPLSDICEKTEDGSNMTRSTQRGVSQHEDSDRCVDVILMCGLYK